MPRMLMTALALLSLVLPGSAQDRARNAKPCDARKIAVADYCPTCKRMLGRYDVRLTPTKICKRCENEPSKVEFCVKTLPPYYQASCHPAKKRSKPFVCCGKLHSTPILVENRARVHYECKYCKARADTRSGLDHAETCVNAFAVVRVCSKSGQPPHVGR